jgi:Pyruvate/2-oxoacid:ferredoxin oxidoreductase gamma subunit
MQQFNGLIDCLNIFFDNFHGLMTITFQWSEVGLGGRINTAMETAFFKLAEIMPFEQVLPILKEEALKSYGHKSMKVVEKNIQAISIA